MRYNTSNDLENFAAATKELCALSGIRCDVTARSILGKQIPVFTLGNGKKAVVYVGGIKGNEALTSFFLLDFLRDCIKQSEKESRIYDVTVSYLLRERRIMVIPMLNPDGVGYATEGVREDNPLCARVLQMNGTEDFSAWQANARGVELSHNFDAGFLSHKNLERAAGILSGALQWRMSIYARN